MNKEIEEIIEGFLNKMEEFSFYPKIEFIILYGSQLSNYNYEDSDIDLCLYIDNKKEKELSEIRLNILKKINDKLDIQMFQLLPLYVQNEVLKGKVIYVRDENLLYKIVYKVIEEFEDFYPFYSDYINR